ncbi:MAG: putative metal-binding motif-containing protein [Deltaproteobacteria bacterium]|nr:putative metal-binding motif-containing protein [Deltaproteobacteria bacterium]
MRHNFGVNSRLRIDPPWRIYLITTFFCLSFAACVESETIELPPLSLFDGGSIAEKDADIEAGFGPVSCQDDSQCDDGIMCNRDFCGWNGICTHIPDPDFCDDGVFCNGAEICHAIDGCKSGVPVVCDDHSVCTVDRCDEETRSCIYTPRDFDGDGEIDWHCLNGTDCDDFDPERGSRMSEICDDGIDNDCDGETDESECGRPEYDLCEGALEVSGSGSYLVDIRGAASNYLLSCAENDEQDVALALLLSETRDVSITANGIRAQEGTVLTTVAIRKNCDDAASESDCNSGNPGKIRLRALPAGRYFILVSSAAARQVAVEIDLREPTDSPLNTTCESPVNIAQEGGFAGDFVDVSDDYEVVCGAEGSSDLVYEFSLDERRDVVISAGNSKPDRMSFAVRTVCDDADSTVECVTGEPAVTRIHQLDPGTYYVILEGPSYQEIDFEINLAFEDPTPPPLGDDCSDPAPLSLSKVVGDTLIGKSDKVATSCGFYFKEMVYRFEIEQPSDVGLRIDGGDAPITATLSTRCGDRESELSCISNAPAVKRFRNLQPDVYYLVVESIKSTNFVLIAERLPLTLPTEVSGNERCEDAFAIPPTGGLFAGDTSRMTNDYVATKCGGNPRSNDAVFSLSLSETKRVKVQLDAAFESVFDTVLYRFIGSGDGAGECESGQESACDDDGGSGTNSQLDELLQAGDHYYVVDGLGLDNEGEYILNVEVSDP